MNPSRSVRCSTAVISSIVSQPTAIHRYSIDVNPEITGDVVIRSDGLSVLIEMEPLSNPTIHTYTSSLDKGLVNAYLVETESGVVAIDGTLTVSDGLALRDRVSEIGKPLLAVLLTHPHPDHYGGLTHLVGEDDVQIVATDGVDAIIRRDDDAKEAILRPMFGEEWPEERTFPNRTVEDDERLTIDGVTFSVQDLGPGESPHDSLWILEGDDPVVFVGDVVYEHRHAYLADGYATEWLETIATLRAQFDEGTTFYVGHGDPGSVELLDWTESYIETFVQAVEAEDWSDVEGAHAAVHERMAEFLPTEDLRFLMDLSIEPMATKLGRLPDASSAPAG